MARTKPTSEPSASVRARRPYQAAEANRSNVRIDELDAQNEWLAHMAAGRITVR
jgi:hypothetical protein